MVSLGISCSTGVLGAEFLIGYGAFCIYTSKLWADGTGTSHAGHVNNVKYVRYAESSRVWYFRRLAKLVPPQHRQEWDELVSPRGIGLILKSISVEYLFVRTRTNSLIEGRES